MNSRAYAYAIVITSISFSPALAVEYPSLSSIASKPQVYVGRTIAFRNAPCVNDPKEGFLCVIETGGRTLRVEAGALGMAGGEEVGERLIGPCKGLDKLKSSACRFDIEITPRSAQSEATMGEFEGRRTTRLYSGDIDMRVPRRR